MNRGLVMYEDREWRKLRPLTDVLPVQALTFGAAHLASRMASRLDLPWLSVEARADALAAWSGAPASRAGKLSPKDSVLAINAAALPGMWLVEVLETRVPSLFTGEGRIAGALVPHELIAPGIGRGAEFETFLLGLGLPAVPVEARFLTWPWQLVEWNADAIEEDLPGALGARRGEVHETAVLLDPERVAIEEDARIEPFAVLDARGGPIWVGPGARVAAHTVVTGPCVIGERTQLLGGHVSRTSFGPECRIAGEVEECVWQGHANKRHHGFVGHSAIGEWVNLGALTTTSDLKNNYGPVRVWVDGAEVETGNPKVGSVLGAHVKTGIGTLLPTGASVGVGANLFGGGRFVPKHVPSFGWWDGKVMAEHRLEACLATARIAHARRGRTLSPGEEGLLRSLFARTAKERSGVGGAP